MNQLQAWTTVELSSLLTYFHSWILWSDCVNFLLHNCHFSFSLLAVFPLARAIFKVLNSVKTSTKFIIPSLQWRKVDPREAYQLTAGRSDQREEIIKSINGSWRRRLIRETVDVVRFVEARDKHDTENPSSLSSCIRVQVSTLRLNKMHIDTFWPCNNTPIPEDDEKKMTNKCRFCSWKYNDMQN